MRLLALLSSLAALAFAGCNLVSTTRPLIPSGAHGLQLRDGLWATQGKDCAFDTAKPWRSWPGCAGAFQVSRGRIRDLAKGKPSRTADFSVSPGQPWLIQIAPRWTKPRTYFYAALDPTGRDAKGRITAFSGWVVSCGPVGKDQTVTAHPFPGLIMTGGKTPSGCTAGDLAILRDAARLSSPASPGGSQDANAHWVRDSAR